MTGPVPENGQHHDLVARLVAVLRATGGTAAVCTACHAVIPTVDGVGLTLFTTHARFVLGATGPLIEQIEDLQISLDQGPCLHAVHHRAPVLVDDLTPTDPRWPAFASHARRRGVAAMFAFPVLLDDHPVAVLDLCRTTAGPLSDTDRRQATVYAAAAAVLLRADADADHGDGAVVSASAARTQQATGMVMHQAGIDAAAALHRLRTHAFDQNQDLAQVVTDVLTRRLRFDPTPG
ncbi:GAF and ANTAR domain-containing protein [Couchioplanes caeruleus]|uniref:ANTAR domain-containing protein n=2 Tax=Couchioplanes caeruleus TaxID=56438 RepID=A0A1K0GND5_9ACTN|nr:GAF and ANTAR domain-containing protein [Couchioplanes caeruleus]OJF13870.1 hypothetical protein BG844_12765 [Couchioplanes caeruleus subsp. caeruleus]ROP30692.1 GAF domain-containing protein [Couchioplanes caeruleus]